MMELTIGRESGSDNPRLAIEHDGKTFYWGKPGSVPRSVSRKHCHVLIEGDASILVEDITENNFLYVNGMDCKRKGGVSMADTIELGPDRYRLDLEGIIKALSSQQIYDISSLRIIYETYQKEKYDLQVSQGKLNALSALPGILSMTSIGLAVFIENARIVMIVVAALFALAFAFIRYRNASKVPQRNRKIEDNFREHYICPNPACGHFLGGTPYKELLKNRACPYCKSKFTE